MEIFNVECRGWKSPTITRISSDEWTVREDDLNDSCAIFCVHPDALGLLIDKKQWPAKFPKSALLFRNMMSLESLCGACGTRRHTGRRAFLVPTKSILDRF